MMNLKTLFSKTFNKKKMFVGKLIVWIFRVNFNKNKIINITVNIFKLHTLFKVTLNYLGPFTEFILKVKSTINFYYKIALYKLL